MSNMVAVLFRLVYTNKPLAYQDRFSRVVNPYASDFEVPIYRYAPSVSSSTALPPLLILN